MNSNVHVSFLLDHFKIKDHIATHREGRNLFFEIHLQLLYEFDVTYSGESRESAVK